MSSREEILESIRRNTVARYEKPDYTELEREAIRYADPIAHFCEMTASVGGKAVILGEDEDINDVIRQHFPDARRVASYLKEVKSGHRTLPLTVSTFHPDDVAMSGDLDGTDLAVIEGCFGVSETAAVWVRQEVEQRAVYFISEALVIILDRHAIVQNMHEAYGRIDTGKYGYGVFISGPSKTADIEQALVMGAHGARTVLVILV